MADRLVDLSQPIVTGHFRWTVERKTVKSHAAGDIAQITWIGAGVHGFTHVDSERHFAPDGPTFDDLPLSRFVGPAAVVDLSDIQADTEISGAQIEAAASHVEAGDIVLLRTGWDLRESIHEETFWTRAPYMSIEACRWLMGRKISAVAFDFPQDRCIRDYVTGARAPALEENTTHVELLLKGVLMFEYLCNMMSLTRRRVQFIGLPLKLPECDGSPIRAVAVESDEADLIA